MYVRPKKTMHSTVHIERLPLHALYEQPTCASFSLVFHVLSVWKFGKSIVLLLLFLILTLVLVSTNDRIMSQPTKKATKKTEAPAKAPAVPASEKKTLKAKKPRNVAAPGR